MRRTILLASALMAGAFALFAPVTAAPPVRDRPVPERTVTIKDPVAFAAALRAMGYKPGALLKEVMMPAFLMDVGTLQTRFTFGGCTAMKACKYLYISSSYTDVMAPPADWLVKMNDAFDIIKVSTDAERALFFSATHVIEGVPRSTLRQILDMWRDDSAALAEEARKAGLVKAD